MKSYPLTISDSVNISDLVTMMSDSVTMKSDSVTVSNIVAIISDSWTISDSLV